MLGLLVPFLIFGVQSYFFGFSMMDYNNERRQRSIRESSHFVWRHKGLAVANGALFHTLLMIPILGLLIAPAYSVIAACLATLKLEENG